MLEVEQEHTGFYLGGGGTTFQENLTGYRNSFSFQIERAHYTDKDDVFHIEASLKRNSRNHPSREAGNFLGIPWLTAAKLELLGFWSISSGEMCLVGEEGNEHSLTALLKLSNFNQSSNITSLSAGSLEIFHDNNDSGPISVLIVPNVTYEYSNFSASEKLGDLAPGKARPEQNLPLAVLPSFCSIFPEEQTAFWLKYASNCSFAKDCFPFSGVVDSVPYYVSFVKMECSDVTKRLRVLVGFSNTSHSSYFSPNMTLVGEGFWDDQKNESHIVLCQFLGITNSWSNAHIGDCTTRLSLRLPAVLSIQQSNRFSGQIWSSKAVNDSGYFKEIVFNGISDPVIGVSGMQYEYSETSRVEKLCPVQKAVRKDGEVRSIFSHNMKFNARVTDSEGHTGGMVSFIPVSIGDRFYGGNSYVSSLSWGNGSSSSSTNISYNVYIYRNMSQSAKGGLAAPFADRTEVKISAEGVYDSRTQRLCMVGCRDVINPSKNNQSITDYLDCDIHLDLQLLAPKFSRRIFANGRIESLREKGSDPLYFEPVNVTSYFYNMYLAREAIIREAAARMNLEIIISLTSNTLSCLFVASQLLHARKNFQVVLPSISMVMLLVLFLEYLFPLVLNIEDVLLQHHDYGYGAVPMSSRNLLETNKVVVRITTMVALFLLFRLLQLTWSGKSNDGNRKSLVFGEKMTLVASLPLYAIGAFIAIFLHIMKMRGYSALDIIKRDLKSYAGLVSDIFLLPQLLLNLFMNSRETALTSPFYVGTSFLRLLPHAYNLYRSHRQRVRFAHKHVVVSYIYATPGGDFYSTNWDIIVSLVILLFAAVIFLQQKFGGRCILPRKFRGRGGEYDKVPTTVELQLSS